MGPRRANKEIQTRDGAVRIQNQLLMPFNESDLNDLGSYTFVFTNRERRIRYEPRKGQN